MLRWKKSLRAILHQALLAPPLVSLYDRYHDRFHPTKSTQSLGNRGELAAERFLLRLGYVIIERGYHDKTGEVDLIAVDHETVVFVEVKTRTSDAAGDPTEAVDEAKQRHLTSAATGYLKWHRLTDCRARFDVIAIIWPAESNPPQITHYENAFEPVGKFQMF
jgi:putative endonuclease